MTNKDFEDKLDKETLVGDYKESYVAEIEERISQSDAKSKEKEIKETEEELEVLDPDDEYNVTQESTKGFHLPIGNLLGGFIAIIVGINLIPTIQKALNNTQYNTTAIDYAIDYNATSYFSTISNIAPILPILFTLGIVGAGIAITVGGLRRARLM